MDIVADMAMEAADVVAVVMAEVAATKVDVEAPEMETSLIAETALTVKSSVTT